MSESCSILPTDAESFLCNQHRDSTNTVVFHSTLCPSLAATRQTAASPSEVRPPFGICPYRYDARQRHIAPRGIWLCQDLLPSSGVFQLPPVPFRTSRPPRPTHQVWF